MVDDLVAVDEVEVFVGEWQSIDVSVDEVNVLEPAELSGVLERLPGSVDCKNERVSACMRGEVGGIAPRAGTGIENAPLAVEQLRQADDRVEIMALQIPVGVKPLRVSAVVAVQIPFVVERSNGLVGLDLAGYKLGFHCGSGSPSAPPPISPPRPHRRVLPLPRVSTDEECQDLRVARGRIASHTSGDQVPHGRERVFLFRGAFDG